MSLVLMQFLLVAAVAALGMTTGWVLRGFEARSVRGDLNDASRHQDDRAKEVQQAHEVLSRLHDLAARVAANVGEHNSRVEEINEQLSAAEGIEPDAVVTAVDQLLQANQRMQKQLSQAEKRLCEQAQKIEYHAVEARTDALTGLANRRVLDDEMVHHLAEFRQHGAPLSFTMVDIDHFKKFNNTYGHQAGDEVLRRVARALSEIAEKEDIVTRYGGEEFAVIHAGIAIEEAKVRAERMRTGLEALRFSLAGKQVQVTASVGVAQLLAGEDASALVQRADEALYAAKAAGRNHACWHDGLKVRSLTEPKAAPRAQDSATNREPGPPNRKFFCMSLGSRLAEWRRGGPTPSVLFAQINNYHSIVSCHGTAAGTLILRAMSQFLGAATRGSDVVARFDGAVFAMMLPGIDRQRMAGVAERLRQAVSQCSIPTQSGSIRFTISLGAAEATEGDHVESLLGRARQALEKANESGGDCTCLDNGKGPEVVAPTAEATG